MQIARKRCRIAPDIHGTGNFAAHLRNWFAGFNRIEIGKLFRPCFNQIGGLQQNQRTLRCGFRRPAPVIESLTRARNRAFHIGLVASRIAAYRDAMAGRYAFNSLAALASNPFTINQHREFTNFKPIQRLRFYDYAHHHFPSKFASRFSVNERTPSFRSPVLATRMEPSASTAVPLSSPLATESISLEITSAAGPRLATRAA